MYIYFFLVSKMNSFIETQFNTTIKKPVKQNNGIKRIERPFRISKIEYDNLISQGIKKSELDKLIKSKKVIIEIKSQSRQNILELFRKRNKIIEKHIKSIFKKRKNTRSRTGGIRRNLRKKKEDRVQKHEHIVKVYIDKDGLPKWMLAPQEEYEQHKKDLQHIEQQKKEQEEKKKRESKNKDAFTQYENDHEILHSGEGPMITVLEDVPKKQKYQDEEDNKSTTATFQTKGKSKEASVGKYKLKKDVTKSLTNKGQTTYTQKGSKGFINKTKAYYLSFTPSASEAEDEDEITEFKDKTTGKGRVHYIKGSGKHGEHAMTSKEIDDILHHELDNFIGTIPLDEIDFVIKYIEDNDSEDFSFIFNTKKADYFENKEHVGHFIAVNYDRYSLEIYDPLADPISEKIKEYIIEPLKELIEDNVEHLVKLKHNKVEQESADSYLCGWFCIRFLLDRYNGISWKEATDYDSDIDEEIDELREEFGYI